MNPHRLRAGKAVDKTGQSALLPESSEMGKRQVTASIPDILFEGDEPSKSPERPFEQKFELGAPHVSKPAEQEETKLPESYGTGKLLLSARDPHTLFAHWDFTDKQQREYTSLAADRHLTLRAYAHAFSNQPAIEIAADPSSRHLFLKAEHAGTSYVAELGYYQADRTWKTVAVSGPATTPSDSPSQEANVVFSTPEALRPTQVKTQMELNVPGKLDQPSIIPVTPPRWPFGPEDPSTDESRLKQAQQTPEDAPPFVKRTPRKGWTQLQEQLLGEIIRVSLERREWISSAEIAKLVRHEVSPSSEIAWPVLPRALVNVSSPVGGEQPRPKGFWFNINAELIIYGATEPNAQVTIAGQPIQLRPDGTFTCHFALPDGNYALAATAISPENEQREAKMTFSRHTKYSGEIGLPGSDSTPQNSPLERIPQPE
jgi:hypothetical protein